MGIVMDIELNLGQITPKITVADATQPPLNQTAQVVLPAFSTSLLELTSKVAPLPSKHIAAPRVALGLPILGEAAAEPAEELITVAPTELAPPQPIEMDAKTPATVVPVKDTPAHTEDVVEEALNVLPEAPLVIPVIPNVAVPREETASPKPISLSEVSAPKTMPTLPQAHLTAPKTVETAQPTEDISAFVAAPRQHAVPVQAMQALPTPAPNQVFTATTTVLSSSAPVELPFSPEPELAEAVVLPKTSASPSAPIINISQPVQTARVDGVLRTSTNETAALSEFDEMQFGVRIERQSVETSQPHMISPKAAPAIANQISTQLPHLLSKADSQKIELRLDPPELGRVTIHLNTHDQQVTAHITADRVETVDLMRRHADILTATLAKAGFSESNLSFQQGGRHENEHNFKQIQNLSVTSESSDASEVQTEPIGTDGRLDIRL